LGIGELNAAIINAIYHSTGKRVRELRIRLEKLIGVK